MISERNVSTISNIPSRCRSLPFITIKILTSNLVEKSIGTYISHQLCDEYVKVDLLSYLYVDKKSDDDNNDAVVNVS